MTQPLASLPRQNHPAEGPVAERSGRTEHSSFSASLSPQSFKDLFRGHPGGVAVITADAGDGPVALTATSVSSASAEPPLLTFSISALSSASASLGRADTVVVHLLDADDLDIAKLGATSGIDRFADTSRWTRLATGEPVFAKVRAWVRCAVIGRMEAGSSTVIAAHALEATISRGNDDETNALAYHNRTWHRLDERSRLS
ncbi:MAG: flavin reductase family protein [Microbacterium sp.]|uniref:flavin reductase family protein n=1 Tax=Microbacterium sp. TaxID=51671 RepID=UPI001AD1DFC7|nr:flavin reductase family protein [Microbacterium sp.]MBN9178416.1 flavin reductase family protein [Microbacterium sp.]